MEPISLSPERKAQLAEYAKGQSMDPAAALDQLLAAYLEWERDDFEQSVESIRAGYEDVKAGRTRTAAECFDDLRRRHGFPR